MIKAQSLAPSWYTPQTEIGAERPARFHLRPLSAGEWLEFMSLPDTDIKGRMNCVFAHGLLDWDNVESAEGGALEFGEAAVWMLPYAVLDEIGAQVINISKLSEGAAKN